MIEVHAGDAHVAVPVNLHKQALRELILVVHRGGTRHIFISAVLDRHIADRSASERGKSRLHNAPRIIQREMQMSAKCHDLRIFRENVGNVTRCPIGSEIASVYGSLDHRMRQHENELIGILFCDLSKRLIQPCFCGLRIGDGTRRLRNHRNHMEAVHHAMPVVLRR